MTPGPLSVCHPPTYIILSWIPPRSTELPAFTFVSSFPTFQKVWFMAQAHGLIAKKKCSWLLKQQPLEDEAFWRMKSEFSPWVGAVHGGEQALLPHTTGGVPSGHRRLSSRAAREDLVIPTAAPSLSYPIPLRLYPYLLPAQRQGCIVSRWFPAASSFRVSLSFAQGHTLVRQPTSSDHARWGAQAWPVLLNPGQG